MNQKQNNVYRQGQAMLITVLVLSSTVLSLSAIGGYLMLVRLRSSSDIMSTTKAIYVADSGLECEAFNQRKGAKDPAFCNSNGRNTFQYDGPSVDSTAVYVTSYTAGSPSRINSIGSFRTSNRAFEMDID